MGLTDLAILFLVLGTAPFTDYRSPRLEHLRDQGQPMACFTSRRMECSPLTLELDRHPHLLARINARTRCDDRRPHVEQARMLVSVHGGTPTVRPCGRSKAPKPSSAFQENISGSPATCLMLVKEAIHGEAERWRDIDLSRSVTMGSTIVARGAGM